MFKLIRQLRWLSKSKNSKGIGMIETTVALAVIIIALVGTLSLVVISSSSIEQSEGKLIAQNLAREGIEVIKNKRDTNWLVGNKWDNGFSISTEPGDDTVIIKFDSSVREWTLDFGPNLILDLGCELYLNSEGLYSHESSGNEKTIFSRLVTIKFINEDQRKIISLVQWTRGKKTYSINLEEDIFDWK